MERIGLWENIWVPYPKFLVMFENNVTCKSACPTDKVNSDDLKVDDSEIEKVQYTYYSYLYLLLIIL